MLTVSIEESAWQKKKRARMTRSQVDAVERFQQLPAETFAGMQDYWVKAMSTGSAGPLGSDLPRMGVELNAIPAMSAEAERVFSGYAPAMFGYLHFAVLTTFLEGGTLSQTSVLSSVTLSLKRLNASSLGRGKIWFMERGLRFDRSRPC
jgi:hypothetical protein